jgi:hypothetical protein
MTTIRPDAPERLSECQTLILLIRDASAPELRKQHLDRLQRLLDMLTESVEEK